MRYMDLFIILYNYAKIIGTASSNDSYDNFNYDSRIDVDSL